MSGTASDLLLHHSLSLCISVPLTPVRIPAVGTPWENPLWESTVESLPKPLWELSTAVSATSLKPMTRSLPRHSSVPPDRILSELYFLHSCILIVAKSTAVVVKRIAEPMYSTHSIRNHYVTIT